MLWLAKCRCFRSIVDSKILLVASAVELLLVVVGVADALPLPIPKVITDHKLPEKHETIERFFNRSGRTRDGLAEFEKRSALVACSRRRCRRSQTFGTFEPDG